MTVHMKPLRLQPPCPADLLPAKAVEVTAQHAAASDRSRAVSLVARRSGHDLSLRAMLQHTHAARIELPQEGVAFQLI